MKHLSLFFFISFYFAAATAQETAPLNKLTPAEDAAGFELLFDGKTKPPDKLVDVNGKVTNWNIEDSALRCLSQGMDYSLCTYKEYTNFEMRFSMKLGSARQNSGVFFRWKGRGMGSYRECTEMGIQGMPHSCDYECHTGDNYHMQAATHYPQVMGEYNDVHVLMNGNFVEFWIRGEKVNEFEINSEEWLKQLNIDDKYTKYPEYAQHKKGYICLQDHGSIKTDEFWVRNIRIRGFGENTKVPTPLIEVKKVSDDSALVAIDVGMVGAEIRYTTGGEEPDTNSNLYSGPFGLNQSSSIKARAWKAHFTASDMATDEFKTVSIRPPVRIRQSAGGLVLHPRALEVSVDLAGPYAVEVLDFQGRTLASTAGRGARTLRLAVPSHSGRYLVRVSSPEQTYSRSFWLVR